MIYEQVSSSTKLTHIIKSYWLIDSEGDASVSREKIIPDGYPEMIFHYGDSYRINISGHWKTQHKEIIAGQIRNHFFLENTGVSRMFAIKFQPWALKELFGISMNELTDDVIPFSQKLSQILMEVKEMAISDVPFHKKVKLIEDWFITYMQDSRIQVSPKHQIVSCLIEHKGRVELTHLQEKFDISERTLERYFKTYIGVPPKFYSRILRFSSIFKLIDEAQIDWQDIVYQAGYYDQSHFIKNFKEFTGEDPGKYGFSEKTMANFFLKP